MSSILNAVRYASTSAASAVSAGKHKVLVIGGGSAGLSVANQLYNTFANDGQKFGKGDIAIVDSAETHHFQPGWTLVGSGLASREQFARPLDSLIPSHLTHIKSNAKAFSPSSNSVELENGETLKYDYLIVAAGLQINFKNIKGLEQALTRPTESKVSTIYTYATAPTVFSNIQALTSGKALFTQPFGPVKCAGAPQKICYTAWDYWKQHNVRDNIDIEFVTGMPTMFSAPHYSKPLDELRQSRGIGASFNTNLVEIKEDDRVAVFKELAGEKKTIEKNYDFIHVTPPMGPLDALKSSPLADAAGWVDVSASTLQSKKFDNVFSLGDCSSLPTSKTAAAITAQAPVLVHNLKTLMETGVVGKAEYDGYTSCPLFVGENKLMLAEFGYNFVPHESFGKIYDQRQPSRAAFHLIKDVVPKAYWASMVKGGWFGPRGVIPPQWL